MVAIQLSGGGQKIIQIGCLSVDALLFFRCDVFCDSTPTLHIGGISSAISWDVVPDGPTPILDSRSKNSGVFSAATISAEITSMTSLGVFFGAIRPL